ncbi:hypothetical protein [Pseudonocardia sp. TRM90224]|uniref:hypothetical protein n=1 Tax=Pseudonocardia sp. TRM90224 TaxID=2812678 RepID=UPI001E469ED1|nr:hypothetical protein [Pseudonocardia sp. TRM90224]
MPIWLIARNAPRPWPFIGLTGLALPIFVVGWRSSSTSPTCAARPPRTQFQAQTTFGQIITGPDTTTAELAKLLRAMRADIEKPIGG